MPTTIGEQIAVQVAVTQMLPPMRNKRAATSPSANSAAVAEMTRRCATLATRFRASIQGLPLVVFADCPSNALTALAPTNGASAYNIYCELKSRFGLVVTPNGGKLRERVFRVGHMGNLAESDLNALASALKEIAK